jgi:hypothetical protein
MTSISRRAFGSEALGSLLTFTVLETLFTTDSFGKEIQPVTARWLAELNQMSLDLKGQKLKQVEWQKQVESLLAKADLDDLLRFVDFDKLTAKVEFKVQGERSLRPTFPQVEGLPTELVFGRQVFALAKGKSVAPHGHDNMATCFLVMRGDFHGRHYDRLEDTKEHMIIVPTIDRQFGPGGHSSISDDKDNVHWFLCTSETGFIFNIHVMSVKPGRTGRVYLDPQGEQLSGGRIKARKLTAEEAYRLYG